MKTTALKLLLPLLLLTLSCRVVGAAEEEGATNDNTLPPAQTPYQQQMENARKNNPGWEALELLFENFEESEAEKKALESDLDYNQRVRQHLKTAARKARRNLAEARDIWARWGYHVTKEKIVYVGQLTAEALVEKRQVEAECANVDQLNEHTVKFCQEELALINQHIAQLKQLLMQYQQELSTQ